MVPPHYFMKTLCRQLNYNLDGEYFKGCWDGGRDLSPNWGGIWCLGVGGRVVFISLLIDNTIDENKWTHEKCMVQGMVV